ncbi:MAG: peptide chain release factor N(5)-glutamine methyltransferase [Acidiferrobacterales bacterium]
MAESMRQYMEQAVAELTPCSPSPRLDAEALIMHVCAIDRAGIITRSGEMLGDKEAQQLDSLLLRRKSGEPIAYLTGKREFWSIDLRVSPDTLIPRPETETLVEHALACIPREAAWDIADLGTGSGAIALAIISERRSCRIVATDVSLAALEIARENARSHGFDQITFQEGHWFAALAGRQFDMLVSNPPYVCEGDACLNAGDVRFEPNLALVAGSDGLNAIREIAEGAHAHLRPGAWLLLEHGFDQARAVRDILARQGYQHCGSHPDLAGHARITVGRQP